MMGFIVSKGDCPLSVIVEEYGVGVYGVML